MSAPTVLPKSYVAIRTLNFSVAIVAASFPGAEWSKASVCGPSLPGIAGSNPAVGTGVSCECCVCQVQVSASG